MTLRGSKDQAGVGTPALANRRDVLLGATGLAVAAATSTVLGTGVANAAPSSGPMSGQIEGIGSFEVLAFSWGASNSGSLHVGGGGGAGKANIQDLSLTKYTDEFSPDLVEAVATGVILPKASVTFVPPKGKGGTLLLKLEQVLVTSISLGGSAGESRLTENVSLNFARFSYSYGSAETDWDIASGR